MFTPFLRALPSAGRSICGLRRGTRSTNRSRSITDFAPRARVPPMRGGSRRPVQAFPTCNYRRKQRRSSAASPPLLSSSMGHTAFTAQRVMFLAAPVVTHRCALGVPAPGRTDGATVPRLGFCSRACPST